MREIQMKKKNCISEKKRNKKKRKWNTEQKKETLRKEIQRDQRPKKIHPTQDQIVVEINGKLKAVWRWKTEIISCVLFNFAHKFLSELRHELQ